MTTQVVINGREVTNPAAKAAISAVAVLLAGIIAAGIIFLVLPLIGVVVTLSVGLVGVVLLALGIGIPLFLLGGSIVGALLTPFAVMREGKRNKKLG